MELSVVMKRVSTSPYKIELESTSIKNVAKDTKHLAAEYIKNGNDITQAFIAYATPLVGRAADGRHVPARCGSKP